MPDKPKVTIEDFKDEETGVDQKLVHIDSAGGFFRIEFDTLEEICDLGKAIQDAAIRQMMIESGIGQQTLPPNQKP